MNEVISFDNSPIEVVTFSTREGVDLISYDIPIKVDSSTLHQISETEGCPYSCSKANDEKLLPEAIPSTQIFHAICESTGEIAKCTLPQKPLAPAQISMPAPIKKEIFQVTEKETEAKITGVQISRYLRHHYQIRIFQEKIYIFNEDRSIYEYFTQPALHRVIYHKFGKTIEDQNNVRAYYEAVEYLLKDDEIVIAENFLLPRQFWGFQNGLLDTEQGQLYKNTGQFFVRHVLQCKYLPHTLCPNFEKFLLSISAGDPLLTSLLWETIGYLLSCDTNGKVFLHLSGRKIPEKAFLPIFSQKSLETTLFPTLVHKIFLVGLTLQNSMESIQTFAWISLIGPYPLKLSQK